MLSPETFNQLAPKRKRKKHVDLYMSQKINFKLSPLKSWGYSAVIASVDIDSTYECVNLALHRDIDIIDRIMTVDLIEIYVLKVTLFAFSMEFLKVVILIHLILIYTLSDFMKFMI